MARRIGRWVYSSNIANYGAAGWHLDGTPYVIDFMPGHHGCCVGGRNCCHGCYLLYNWPGREYEPVALYLRDAMEYVEEMVDETQPGRYRTNIVKPFCPCDTGRPQDCQPEDWPGAHAEPPCLNCGRKSYAHFGTGRFCERPSSREFTARCETR